MKAQFLFLIVLGCLFVSFSASAQYSTTDSIHVKRTVFNTLQFKQRGEPIPIIVVNDIMANNRKAYDLMWHARNFKTQRDIAGFVGGAVLGYSLGRHYAGRDLNVIPIVVGAGLIGLSIPLNIFYKKNAMKAVDLFNEGLK